MKIYINIILIVLILSLIIIIYTLQKCETFDTTSNIIVVQSSSPNFGKWTKSNGWSIRTIDNTISTWKSTKIQIQEQTNNQQVLFLCDPLDVNNNTSTLSEYNFTPTSNQQQIPPGYFIGIVHPKIKKYIDVPYNFENRTIGYYDISDYYFIKAIIYSYRMDITDTKFIQLKTADLQNIIPVMENNKIDILILYVILNSDLYNYIISQKVSILGFTNLNFDRIHLYNPYITPTNINLKDIFTSNPSSQLLIPDSDNATVLPTMTMKLIDISNMSSTIPKNVATFETFISRLSLDPESTEANYRCYGNPYSESKSECESTNDIYGEPVQPIKWDKMCTSNEECPFYKKNTYYPNERGGCLDSGLCEMPVGVLQSSPRKYFDTGRFKPFCYGCSNNIDCCTITNDYAFANDYSDRIANGLKTSIPIM